MTLKNCRTCGKALPKRDSQFCDRACYSQAYRNGIITNRGWFRKGIPSLNKGKTLESWVGKERAREIRHRMSENSKGKAGQLRRLNEDPRVLGKRRLSRRFHEAVVQTLVKEFRTLGWRCYTLSEYVKEERTPDAILFDGRELVALEVEVKKKWKPTEASMTRRLTDLNGSSRFFDRTSVVFPDEGLDMAEQVPMLVGEILNRKRLYEDSPS